MAQPNYKRSQSDPFFMGGGGGGGVFWPPFDHPRRFYSEQMHLYFSISWGRGS